MQLDPAVVTIGLIVFPILIGTVGWFIRHSYQRLERELDEERKAREGDRHALRNEINAVGNKLSVFELVVARECINHERLAEVMAPFTTRLMEIRTDIKELFDRTDGTAGRRRGGD